MTFEGEHKVIPIKGIVRAGADSICEDGAMNEVVGFEYKDGSYVPYKEKDSITTEIPNDALGYYIHKTSTGNIALFIDQYGNLYWIPEDDITGASTSWADMTPLSTGPIKDVEFIGDAICFSTNDDYKIYIYNKSTYNEYNNFSVDNGISIRMVDGIGGQSNDTYGVWFATDIENDVNVDFIKAEGIAHERGGLVGHVFAAVACRYNTGEIVNLSNVVLLRTPRDSDRVILDDLSRKGVSGCAIRPNVPYTTLDIGYATKDRSGGEGTISDSSNYYGVKTSPALYRFEVDTDTIVNGTPTHIIRYGCVYSCGKIQLKINSSAFTASKNVSSICVFISKDISRFANYEDFLKGGPHNILRPSEKETGYYPIEKLANLGDDNVRDINSLHLVAEYDITEISRDTWIDVNLEGKLGDALYTLPSMKTSDISMYQYHNAYIDNYNFRIHLHNFTQNVYYPYGALSYEGYSKSLVAAGEQLNSVEMEVDVYLRDALEKEYKIVLYNNDANEFLSVGNLISFPSLDAYKIIVRKRAVLDYYYVRNYKAEFNLKKHNGLGIAYCLVTQPLTLESTTYNLPVETSIPLDSSDGNKLIVSDTYTPYYFPKQNTYTIGNGRIIGLASLSIALSQDTFGQYPLLVFCTDGVYSMGVDTTGAGVYNNIAPFSREICVNRNTICEIDGAVLFASSKGLMIATAQGVQEFLPMINGTPKHLPEYTETTKGLGLLWYKDIISSPVSTDMMGSISTKDFIDFLSDKDTVVSYVSEKNKVIVYNGGIEYVYWIDIPTRNVTKLPVCIKLDNNNYPIEQYVKNDGIIITLPYLSDKGDVQCLLQTRPIKIVNTLKSSLRVVARGYLTSNDPSMFACMLVLGSLDAINWQPIGYKTRQFNGGFNDLGCVTDRVSCNYIMVIVTGSMNSDSHIDGIELTVNSKYNNKLK